MLTRFCNVHVEWTVGHSTIIREQRVVFTRAATGFNVRSQGAVMFRTTLTSFRLFRLSFMVVAVCGLGANHSRPDCPRLLKGGRRNA